MLAFLHILLFFIHLLSLLPLSTSLFSPSQHSSPLLTSHPNTLLCSLPFLFKGVWGLTLEEAVRKFVFHTKWCGQKQRQRGHKKFKKKLEETKAHKTSYQNADTKKKFCKIVGWFQVSMNDAHSD
jgi:hypothetical protein